MTKEIDKKYKDFKEYLKQANEIWKKYKEEYPKMKNRCTEAEWQLASVFFLVNKNKEEK